MPTTAAACFGRITRRGSTTLNLSQYQSPAQMRTGEDGVDFPSLCGAPHNNKLSLKDECEFPCKQCSQEGTNRAGAGSLEKETIHRRKYARRQWRYRLGPNVYKSLAAADELGSS